MGKFEFIRELEATMERRARECEVAARRYLPKRAISRLLIGESPPEGDSYFYDMGSFRWKGGSLPAKVIRALLGKTLGRNQAEYEARLGELRDAGVFITDLCRYPVDGFAGKYRAMAIREEMPAFLRRYRKFKLRPKCPVHLILPRVTRTELSKSEFGDIWESLDKIGVGRKNLLGWGEIKTKLPKLK